MAIKKGTRGQVLDFPWKIKQSRYFCLYWGNWYGRIKWGKMEVVGERYNMKRDS